MFFKDERGWRMLKGYKNKSLKKLAPKSKKKDFFDFKVKDEDKKKYKRIAGGKVKI
jgi:hypothetical protein